VKKPRELRIEQADPRKLNPAAYNPRKISAQKMTFEFGSTNRKEGK
jgi:hypothetical protein